MSALVDNLVTKTLTRTIPTEEALTVAGCKFYVEAVIPDVAAGAEVYVIFKMPAKQTGLNVGLIKRFADAEDGPAKVEILWDSTYSLDGTTHTPTNENKLSSNTSKMVVQSAITVTDDGTVKETIFIPGSALGGRAVSGGISPDVGYRLYDDSFFIAKLTNTHNTTNTMKIGYLFLESPLTRL